MIAAPQDSIAGVGFRAPPAAPAGGARRSRRGRGCDLAALILIGGLVAAPAVAGASTETPVAPPVSVPSGQQVSLQEVLSDDATGALWLRFRFVAPQIATLDPAASAADIDQLCTDVALPYLAEAGIAPERVVISLSEQAVPFGEAAPGVTQFFEAYRPENGRCIWEGL